MDTLWGILTVAGPAVPPILAAVSCVVVYKLAQRLRLSDPSAWSAGKTVALHLMLIVFVAVIGSFLRLVYIELAALGLIPLYLFRRLKRVDARAASGPDAAEARASNSNHGDPVSARSAPRSVVVTREISPTTALVIAWFIGVTGLLLPWVVGLGVKFYLQSQGEPTLPISGFVDPASLAVLLLLTMVMWSSPFLVLAVLVAVRFSVGGSKIHTFRDSLPLVWWTYCAGVVTAVIVFARVFWQFDTMLLLVPLCFLLIPPMALAYWIVSRHGRR